MNENPSKTDAAIRELRKKLAATKARQSKLQAKEQLERFRKARSHRYSNGRICEAILQDRENADSGALLQILKRGHTRYFKPKNKVNKENT